MGAAPSMPSQPHSKLGEDSLDLLGEGSSLVARTPSSTQGNAGTPSNQQQFETLDGSRITVDIRGAELDDDTYHVYVRRNSTTSEKKAGLHQQMATAGGALQGALGIAISLLTVSKLFEEIRFVRSLRRELSSLAGSLPSLGPSGLSAAFPDPAPRGGAVEQRRPGQGVARSPAAPAGQGTLTDELNTSVPGLGAAGEQTCDTTPQPGWASVSGLDSVKQLLQEVTVLPSLRPDLFKGIRQPPRGLLLFGPPGSGKTLLARAVANESNAAFFAITGSSVLSMWYGQSEANVRALFEKARQQQPSVIFIDEVDSLMGKRGGHPGAPGGEGGTTPDRRITNEFLAFIDGIQTESGDAHIIIMAATNHPWDLDEAALSRFSRRIYVPLPDRTARAQLLSGSMRDTPCDMTPQQWLRLADKCTAYSGRDLVVLCREASMRPLRELWGQRLLTREQEPVGTSPSGSSAREAVGLAAEGAAAGTVEQVARARVVSLLAAHLHAGRNAKRLRKELSKWRRQQGGAVVSWCDVDALMQEATQRAHAMAVPAGRAESSAIAGEPAAAPVCDGQPGSAAKPPGLAGGGRVEVRAGAEASRGSAATSPASGSLPARPANGILSPGSSQVLAVQDKEALASPGMHATCNGSLQDKDKGAAAVPAELQASSTSLPTEPARQQDQLEESHRADGTSTTGNGTDAVPAEKRPTAPSQAELQQQQQQPPAASSQDKQPTATASQEQQVPAAANGDPQPVEPPPTSPGSSGKPGTGGKEQPKARHRSKVGREAAAEPAASAGLTLDQLLKLPADHIRPVVMSDFEAALNLIMPSEEASLTAAFEEFNSKFGSGADVKRSGYAKHAYTHIYT